MAQTLGLGTFIPSSPIGVAASFALALILQVAPIVTDVSPWFDRIEKLSLNAALIIAVIALWRKDIKRDDIVIQLIKESIAKTERNNFLLDEVKTTLLNSKKI